MVLTDLGRKINSALHSLTSQPVIDEKALEEMLKEITRALLEADVNVKLVQKLRTNIKNIVNLNDLATGVNKKKIIQKAVYDELCRLVDPGLEPYQPVKNKSNIIMFVGLQGSGKTTSCTKLAYYYQKRGWKTCMICTDTFRAGAFDQLKQNATKAKIPYYGSYTETDPVQIAMDGVEKFKAEKFEIIIVDTSGCHVHETELFNEMTQIASSIQPHNVIFVMDGTIGQTAELQSRNFKNAVPIGSIIMTKMDGHAKGGGAISAVAATGSPIIFIGTGEHMYDLEKFESKRFISKMLGMGDISGLIEKFQELRPDNKEFMKKLEQGQFSIRDMREQVSSIMNLGPLSKVMGMMPGMPPELLGAMGDQEGSKRMRRFMAIMDSMTDEELDGDGKHFRDQPSRVNRVAIGSGTHPWEVSELLGMHGKFSSMVKKMGGKNGFLNRMSGMGGNPRNMNPAQMAKMQQQMMKNMNPAALKQMGGLQNMMKGLGGAGGMPNIAEMMKGLGGLGGLGGAGGGGMPNMEQMAEMMKGFGGFPGLGGGGRK
ncbi:signal recognition particle-containing protein [Paraphysoderma sedebokerense]|nr:signal recognition particle-containing protein [Paraphysoderma sedebokerense]